MLRKCLVDFEVDEKHQNGGDKERASGGVDCVGRQIEECTLPCVVDLDEISMLGYLKCQAKFGKSSKAFFRFCHYLLPSKQWGKTDDAGE